MIDNLQDIKQLIETEKTQEKTEKELYNNLVGFLYNIFNEEIRADLLERGFQYFSYNKTRQEICNELAETQKEYNYYFMNYTKALKQVKSFFSEDIKRINAEQEERERQEQETMQKYKRTEKTKKQKQKHTIFGVNPLLMILFTPILLFFEVLDQTK